jgi:hypothetical protein
LNVPGEADLTGRGVSYCGTCDGFFFRGKKIVAVGGGDSAIKESLFLTKFASHVDVIHRRDTLRAEAALQARARASDKISFIWNTVVEEIIGEGKVQSVRLRNVVTGQIADHPTDGVFIFIGHDPNNGLFQGKLAMDEHGYVITDKLMRTSVEGVFAAGEIQDPLWKQVATSVGQGAAAAMSAEQPGEPKAAIASTATNIRMRYDQSSPCGSLFGGLDAKIRRHTVRIVERKQFHLFGRSLVNHQVMFDAVPRENLGNGVCKRLGHLAKQAEARRKKLLRLDKLVQIVGQVSPRIVDLGVCPVDVLEQHIGRLRLAADKHTHARRVVVVQQRMIVDQADVVEHPQRNLVFGQPGGANDVLVLRTQPAKGPVEACALDDKEDFLAYCQAAPSTPTKASSACMSEKAGQTSRFAHIRTNLHHESPG